MLGYYISRDKGEAIRYEMKFNGRGWKMNEVRKDTFEMRNFMYRHHAENIKLFIQGY